MAERAKAERAELCKLSWQINGAVKLIKLDKERKWKDESYSGKSRRGFNEEIGCEERSRDRTYLEDKSREYCFETNSQGRRMREECDID